MRRLLPLILFLVGALLLAGLPLGCVAAIGLSTSTTDRPSAVRVRSVATDLWSTGAVIVDRRRQRRRIVEPPGVPVGADNEPRPLPSRRPSPPGRAARAGESRR